MPHPSIEFRPVGAPVTAGAADAADFRTFVDVHNRVWREISGTDDHTATPDEFLPGSRPTDDTDRMMWLVLADGEPVGRLVLELPLEPGAKSAFAFVELLRAAWHRGIGSAGLALVERTAHAAGRAAVHTWVEHGHDGDERLAPPTGAGSVPRDHTARFLLRHGWTLEQVVRVSAFPLPGDRDALEAHLADARARASGYRIVQWDSRVPDEHAAAYARMKARMVTDAPAGGMAYDEEDWDIDRVRRHEAEHADAGQTLLVTAAQHEATGELCAFNELSIGPDHTRPSHQEDTLVLAEHRGHRLGMLVKAAGLLTWRERFPDSPRVRTYNAEENRPMLAINEAVGFVPIAYEGAWKKALR